MIESPFNFSSYPSKEWLIRSGRSAVAGSDARNLLNGGKSKPAKALVQPIIPSQAPDLRYLSSFHEVEKCGFPYGRREKARDDFSADGEVDG